MTPFHLRSNARRLLNRLRQPEPVPQTPVPAPAPPAPAPLREGNDGYCHACRQQTFFQIHNAWLRDHYECTKCGSTPRLRHVSHVLDTLFPSWPKQQLHESSPSNGLLARFCTGYSSSQFLPGVPRGTAKGGLRSEDLEALTYADGTFDLFVTQDVMEHVFRPERAFCEILRVLKTGGAHVFTTPLHRTFPVSRQRARMDGDTVVHLDEPAYHGNPVGDGRALVTWDWGQDLEHRIFQWTGAFTMRILTRDRALGLDGEFLEVFVTRKLPA
jgi:SAM-dependent methyltransferase